jgi:hypothetical protein
VREEKATAISIAHPQFHEKLGCNTTGNFFRLINIVATCALITQYEATSVLATSPQPPPPPKAKAKAKADSDFVVFASLESRKRKRKKERSRRKENGDQIKLDRATIRT